MAPAAASAAVDAWSQVRRPPTTPASPTALALEPGRVRRRVWRTHLQAQAGGAGEDVEDADLGRRSRERPYNAVHGSSKGVAVRERIINAVAVVGAVLLCVVLSGTYLGYWNPPLFTVDEGASGVPAAVLCLVLGAMSWVMQRKEPNTLIGLRTRWTLRSNLSWARSHRFAGQSSPVAAAVLILPELLGVRLPGPILFGLFLAWLVLLWSYSYVQWRDDPDRVA